MKALLYELCRWAMVVAIVLAISTSGKSSSVSNVSPQEVLDAVCNSAEMTNMQPASNQIIKRFYGIDPTEYKFCALYFPSSNMDVDELLIIQFSDPSQEQQVEKAAASRLAGQKNVFESYGVEQMELLNNHSIYTSEAGFALFIINGSADKVHTAFIDALRGK